MKKVIVSCLLSVSFMVVMTSCVATVGPEPVIVSPAPVYVEPAVIVPPPVIFVPGPYWGWHDRGYYHGYRGGWRR
jgi:hypothetical protein